MTIDRLSRAYTRNHVQGLVVKENVERNRNTDSIRTKGLLKNAGRVRCTTQSGTGVHFPRSRHYH